MVFNEEFDLAYFSVFDSDFVLSDTSIDIGDDPWSAIVALTSLHVLKRSSLTAYQGVNEAQGSLFKVPARRKSQKSILFGRIESESMTREDSESENELPQFSHYKPNVLRMIENMRYDLISGPGLNFGKGRRTLLQSFVLKGKTPDYYHQNCKGLGLCVNSNPINL